MCELSPVSFHGDTIFCIDYHGEPFTPMKPIVENMGLAWQTQARKLSDNKERWGIIMMVIPTESGEQEMVAMPVRKLPAFLAGINPKKVRPELRPKIELYQNESDNALWDYWTKGRAERKPEQPAQQTITPGDALLQWLLAKEIRRAAEEGRPFTRFGKVSGLHARRGEMDIPLRVLGWKKLQKLFAGLQERGLVTIGGYSKSGGRHLDARVPQRPKPALPPMAKRPAPAAIPEDDRHFAVCAELKAIARRLEQLCPAMAQANYPRFSRRSVREQNRYEMQASLYRMGNASLKTAIASLTASWQIWEMMK